MGGEGGSEQGGGEREREGGRGFDSLCVQFAREDWLGKAGSGGLSRKTPGGN